jgi:hypothetical protein
MERYDPKPMKTTKHPARCARVLLATTLAGFLGVSAVSGQNSDADELRRLREENAALKKRLSE